MNEKQQGRQARSFGAAAELYDRARPGYPTVAAKWLLEGVPADGLLVDLGAGTGKFTRVLTGLGRTVVAVEPSTRMGEALAAVLPGVEVREGSGESIPLPDSGVDAVLAAQAWHWVDENRAVPEVARVLKPGGTLGLLWNTRDEGVEWVAELGARLKNLDLAGPSNWDGVGPPFEAAERRDFPWRQVITPAGLLDLVASRSYVLLASQDDRNSLRDSVRDLTDHHPDLTGRETFELPYVTECWRQRLPR